MRRLLASSAALIMLLLATSPIVFAHAILVRSTPTNQAIVRNHQVEISLDYNSRIDARRCTVKLTNAIGQNLPLRMEGSDKPSELKAVASALANGTYQIHWQVLASDGHITRGDVAFTIAAQ